MPHDANGVVLVDGDLVNFPFRVKRVYEAGDFCNVELESVIPMPGNGYNLTLSAVNTKQVVKQ